MRTRILLTLIILCSSAVWAAGKIQPLDVKMGLWEVTHTSAMTGMPSLPPEALANMTPEQRAMMEATMRKQSNLRPTAEKECMTKEKMDKNSIFDTDSKECTRTVVSSSGSKLEMKIQCVHEGHKMDGTFRLDVINSENVKGTVQVSSTDPGQPVKINSNFTAKWLGRACGTVK
ncbi:MAG: DUF3617 domain-containing protein [Terriglobales bacterium]